MGLMFADVLEDVEARDKRDSERATAPLKPAEDAVIFDTTDLTADAAIARAISLVAAARS
jgi:cytidylate kinase